MMRDSFEITLTCDCNGGLTRNTSHAGGRSLDRLRKTCLDPLTTEVM